MPCVPVAGINMGVFTVPPIGAGVWMEFERGGHWRYVEHTADGVYGFEGRYREVKAVTPASFVGETRAGG